MRPALRVARATAAFGGAAVLLAYALSGVPAGAADATVTVGAPNSNRFDPAKVTVNVGDTVTWQWGGGLGHTVTSDPDGASWHKDTPVGPQGGSQFDLSTTFTFAKAGTYKYFCKTHQGEGMVGQVVVLGASTSPKPKPTKTPTRTPSPTRTSAPPPPPSTSPPPSGATAPPPVLPSGSIPPTPSATVPFPSVAPPPSSDGTPVLGSGGLTPQPPTHRDQGLPVLLALLLVGGVGSAEIRALLANAPAY